MPGVQLCIQGTTHTIEPVGGNPTKWVHRTELRLCPGPRSSTEKVSPLNENMLVVAEAHTSDDCNEPDFVVLEEVANPPSYDESSMQVETDITEDALVSGPEQDREPLLLTDEGEGESVDTGVEEPSISDLRFNLPPIRQSSRTFAGIHTNPFNLPWSTCNATAVSKEIRAVLFEKKRKILTIIVDFWSKGEVY